MMMVRGDDDRDESLYTVDDVHVHSHRADAKCGDLKVNAYYIHSPDAKFGMNLLPQVRKPLLHLLCTSRWQTNQMCVCMQSNLWIPAYVVLRMYVNPLSMYLQFKHMGTCYVRCAWDHN